MDESLVKMNASLIVLSNSPFWLTLPELGVILVRISLIWPEYGEIQSIQCNHKKGQSNMGCFVRFGITFAV